jgi:3-hydroxyacyl-[acyl-carrier-protein] dehydratase
MLMNDLYVLNEFFVNGNRIEGTLTFRPEHPIFKGHFPGQPIVPGVCMVRIVKEVAEHHHRKKLKLTTADTIKFLSVIDPELNHTIRLVIETELEAGAYHTKAVLSRNETTYFKFNGIFEIAL